METIGNCLKDSYAFVEVVYFSAEIAVIQCDNFDEQYFEVWCNSESAYERHNTITETGVRLDANAVIAEAFKYFYMKAF